MVLNDMIMKIKSFKIARVILLVTVIALTTGLHAQNKHLATPIYIQLYGWVSDSEIEDFISDYSEYKLRDTMLCLIWEPRRCGAGWFIFDNRTIDAENLKQILLKDSRVWRILPEITPTIFCWANVVVPNNIPEEVWTPRHFRLLSNQEIDLDDFLNSHAEYMLRHSRGSFNEGGAYFSFNDSIIYAGDLYDIFKADERIQNIWWEYGWVFNDILVVFENLLSEDDIDDFIHDFSKYNIKEPIKLRPPHENEWCFTSDFHQFDEFSLIDEIKQDNRVAYAGLNDYIYYLGCPHIKWTSMSDDTISNINGISVYPNPSRLNDINFKVSESYFRNQRISDIEISIYNVKGQLVKSSTIFSNTNTDRVFVWDKKDNQNKYVSSGVYTYKIKTSDNVYTGKILIIK